MKNVRSRIVATFVVVLMYGWVNFLLNPVATILSGQVAGRQLENSDVSYITAVYGMRFFGSLGVPFLVLLVILAAIWWKHLKMGWAGMFVASLVLGLVLVSVTPSHAYYDKQDWAETYFILSNESAFYIPDVGANKDSQIEFGSEAYMLANKIAAKRFSVPHVKLENSGLWSNFYVPAGRLIIVDRTPYNREWTKTSERGTSVKDESFPCQSSEGLDITAEVSIATSVFERDAARFLYRFGVKPPEGDRKQPEVVFTSVFYGRSLKEIMDGVVRSNIQTLVCRELTNRTLNVGNAEAGSKVMEAIQKSVTTYLTSVGITLDFIGWGRGRSHSIQRFRRP